MPNTLTIKPTVEEAQQLEEALSKIFAKVECIDERIAKDQQETEHLREETRKMLAQLKVR